MLTSAYGYTAYVYTHALASSGGRLSGGRLPDSSSLLSLSYEVDVERITR